jgi:hypothetical protein
VIVGFPGFGRTAVAFFGAVAVCGLGWATANALPRWWPAERLPASPVAVSVGPTGTALVMGFPDSAGHTKLLFRPAGGPPGSPRAIPSALGYPTGTPLDVSWFADGSSLIANPGADMLAYRPPGARSIVGAPQNLSNGKGEGPAEYGCHSTDPLTYCPAIATALNGRALIGLDGNLGVGAAFRSSGARGSVDMRHGQYFGRGTVLGVALDPRDGGAVIAWIDGSSALEEAVRRPGSASFGTAHQIARSPYAAAMATDSSGYAVISWAGGSAGPDSYPTQVFATERGPGGAFGAAHEIGNSPNGDPLTTVPAVTSTGDALVAWTRIASSTSFGATIATEHRGHWSPQRADGPLGSQIAGVASAGKAVLVALSTGLSQTVYDVQTGSSTTTGIRMASPKRVPAGLTAMSVGTSGTALYIYGQTTHGTLRYSMLPYEARR